MLTPLIQVVCVCGAVAEYDEQWCAIVKGTGDWRKAERQLQTGEMAIP